MPHWSLRLLAVAASIGTSLGAAGCARQGELHVVIDSITTANSVEVLALPFDPASVVHSLPSPRPVGFAATLADSLSVLDSAFRAIRDGINRDALSMRFADRRDALYAARYDSLTRRAAAAEALRSRRDRVRARLGRDTPATAPRRSSFPLRATFDSIARAAGRDAVRAPMARSVSLRLPFGTWWIAAVDRAGALTAMRGGVLVGDAGATVKLAAP